MATIIEVDHLAKSYGGKRGIRDVSFRIGEGEVFGFLGPNGAGKTTTIRVLMALLRADSGTARIEGRDCWTDSIEIKKMVGYVPGEPALDPTMTGGQILTYFSNLRGGVDQSYLKELIDRLELDPGRKFRHYSTGNKRKVVLIQAFMHRPRLLVLDEPTSGLDPIHQQEFNRLVVEAQAGGATVLLSSHVLSEVEHTCGRVGIIREGTMVQVGDVAELKGLKHHEVVITFADTPPEELFRGLAGVERMERTGNGKTLRIEMSGGIDGLVKAAARHSVLSLTSKEPSLEEIFLRFYQNDEVARDASIR